MALIYKAEDISGIGAPEAYWKIMNINVNTASASVSIRLNPYKSQADRSAGKTASAWLAREFLISGDDYQDYMSAEVVSGDGKNHISQAYLYIKQKTEFSEAVDA